MNFQNTIYAMLGVAIMVYVYFVLECISNEKKRHKMDEQYHAARMGQLRRIATTETVGKEDCGCHKTKEEKNNQSKTTPKKKAPVKKDSKKTENSSKKA